MLGGCILADASLLSGISSLFGQGQNYNAQYPRAGRQYYGYDQAMQMQNWRVPGQGPAVKRQPCTWKCVRPEPPTLTERLFGINPFHRPHRSMRRHRSKRNYPRQVGYKLPQNQLYSQYMAPPQTFGVQKQSRGMRKIHSKKHLHKHHKRSRRSHLYRRHKHHRPWDRVHIPKAPVLNLGKMHLKHVTRCHCKVKCSCKGVKRAKHHKKQHHVKTKVHRHRRKHKRHGHKHKHKHRRRHGPKTLYQKISRSFGKKNIGYRPTNAPIRNIQQCAPVRHYHYHFYKFSGPRYRRHHIGSKFHKRSRPVKLHKKCAGSRYVRKSGSRKTWSGSRSMKPRRVAHRRSRIQHGTKIYRQRSQYIPAQKRYMMMNSPRPYLSAGSAYYRHGQWPGAQMWNQGQYYPRQVYDYNRYNTPYGRMHWTQAMCNQQNPMDMHHHMTRHSGPAWYRNAWQTSGMDSPYNGQFHRHAPNMFYYQNIPQYSYASGPSWISRFSSWLSGNNGWSSTASPYGYSYYNNPYAQQGFTQQWQTGQQPGYLQQAANYVNNMLTPSTQSCPAPNNVRVCSCPKNPTIVIHTTTPCAAKPATASLQKPILASAAHPL